MPIYEYRCTGCKAITTRHFMTYRADEPRPAILCSHCLDWLAELVTSRGTIVRYGNLWAFRALKDDGVTKQVEKDGTIRPREGGDLRVFGN